MLREFDIVTLRTAIDGHPAGARCTIVDLTGDTAIVEFPSAHDLDVVGVPTADLIPVTAGPRAA